MRFVNNKSGIGAHDSCHLHRSIFASINCVQIPVKFTLIDFDSKRDKKIIMSNCSFTLQLTMVFALLSLHQQSLFVPNKILMSGYLRHYVIMSKYNTDEIIGNFLWNVLP